MQDEPLALDAVRQIEVAGEDVARVDDEITSVAGRTPVAMSIQRFGMAASRILPARVAPVQHGDSFR